ncbi:MAG: aminodeoxychorismate lyase [Chromatiales bacterium]|nr:aminodeoxychorismate lyase [Chromatiales bacterium]
MVDGRKRQSVSVADRGLQYGDGLFETIALSDGEPRRWSLHWQRLESGCLRLGIVPPEEARLLADLRALPSPAGKSVAKIIVTRGSAGRGYRPPKKSLSSRIVTLHDWPRYPQSWSDKGVRVRWCDTACGQNPALAGLKHLNRLEQVLARAEWDDEDVPEGLMCDLEGRPISGTMSNLFVVDSGVVKTPSLTACGVEGVMRRAVMDYCHDNDLHCRVGVLNRADLYQAQEIFLTNALVGIWPVRELGGRAVDAPGPVTARLQARLSTK